MNNYVHEIEKLNYHNMEKNKKLEQYENEIEIMKETKENEIQRRKKQLKIYPPKVQIYHN